MKRLTWREDPNYVRRMNCRDCLNSENCKKDIFDCRLYAVNHLATIEDILDDDYDLDHLRKLVQADREGRCIIAPVKPGEIAWGGHARFDPVLGETKNVIYPVILKGWWTGLKDYEYEPREFRFGDLYESYDAAEKALEGEKHG